MSDFVIAAALTPLHASPLDAHFHWGYQILTMLAIIGLWLFFAGLGQRRMNRRHGQVRDRRVSSPTND